MFCQSVNENPDFPSIIDDHHHMGLKRDKSSWKKTELDTEMQRMCKLFFKNANIRKVHFYMKKAVIILLV